jgi:hypothetical protein
MKARTSLREALSDPGLLGNILAGDSWKAWRVILIAAMGEELTEEERPIFSNPHATAAQGLKICRLNCPFSG